MIAFCFALAWPGLPGFKQASPLPSLREEWYHVSDGHHVRIPCTRDAEGSRPSCPASPYCRFSGVAQRTIHVVFRLYPGPGCQVGRALNTGCLGQSLLASVSKQLTSAGHSEPLHWQVDDDAGLEQGSGDSMAVEGVSVAAFAETGCLHLHVAAALAGAGARAVAGTCSCGEPCSALQVPASYGHPQAPSCSTGQALAETFPLHRLLSRLPSIVPRAHHHLSHPA